MKSFINLTCIFSTYNSLILRDISAEFCLNFNFIIIKIITYSNCTITSFKHLWFILKNIWSFNEMEININNKILTKIYINNKKKRNVIIYHFLVESKPHGRIDLLSVNIYQTKNLGTSLLSTDPLSLSNVFIFFIFNFFCLGFELRF